MPSNYSNCRAFLSADETVAVNTLKTMLNVQSLGVSKYHPMTRFQSVFLYIKGNHASCAKTVVLYFQVSPDNVNWHDLAPVTVTLEADAAVTSYGTVISLDLADVNYIRLGKVKNNETTAGNTVTVNAYMSSKLS